MNKINFLFWQASSLSIAYMISNAYFNINNYMTQLNDFLHVKIPLVFPESGFLAFMIFLVLFVLPNLYVYISLYVSKNDYVNGRIQRDIHINPHRQYIKIGEKSYVIKSNIDRQMMGFALVTILPFVIDYSSLTYLILFFIIFAILMNTAFIKDSLILINPYLRLKYSIFALQSVDKTVNTIMEKEKEFEKPKFSEYVIDWCCNRYILIGFKTKEENNE